MGIGQIKWVMSFIKGGQAKEVTRLIDNISILPRKVGANQQTIGTIKGARDTIGMIFPESNHNSTRKGVEWIFL